MNYLLIKLLSVTVDENKFVVSDYLTLDISVGFRIYTVSERSIRVMYKGGCEFGIICFRTLRVEETVQKVRPFYTIANKTSDAIISTYFTFKAGPSNRQLGVCSYTSRRVIACGESPNMFITTDICINITARNNSTFIIFTVNRIQINPD